MEHVKWQKYDFDVIIFFTLKFHVSYCYLQTNGSDISICDLKKQGLFYNIVWLCSSCLVPSNGKKFGGGVCIHENLPIC